MWDYSHFSLFTIAALEADHHEELRFNSPVILRMRIALKTSILPSADTVRHYEYLVPKCKTAEENEKAGVLLSTGFVSVSS